MGYVGYVAPLQGLPFRGTSCSQGVALGYILAALSALLPRPCNTCRTDQTFLENLESGNLEALYVVDSGGWIPACAGMTLGKGGNYEYVTETDSVCRTPLFP